MHPSGPVDIGRGDHRDPHPEAGGRLRRQDIPGEGYLAAVLAGVDFRRCE